MGQITKTFPSVPAALKTLAALRKEVKSAKTFEQLNVVTRSAVVISKIFKGVDPVKYEAMDVWRISTNRLNEELAKLPKAKGTRGQLKGGKKGSGRGIKKPGGSLLVPPGSDTPTLADLGVSRKQSAQARALGKVPEADQQRIFDKLKAEGSDPTPTNIIKQSKLEQREEKRAEYSTKAGDGGGAQDLVSLAATGKKFSVIYADPPWTFEVYSGKGKERSAERHYDTMKLEDIMALPVAELAADDCALMLWGVWPELPGALEVIKAWGFEYKTCGFLWVKMSLSAGQITSDGAGLHWGMGYWTRANTEPCLFATRGSPTRLDMGVHQVIVSPVGRHSEKPEEARARITRLLPGPYLELFARSPRDGWTTWGNEIQIAEEAAE